MIQKNTEFSLRVVTGKADFEKIEFLASDIEPKLMGDKINVLETVGGVNTTTEVYYYWLIVQKGIPIIIRVYENPKNREESWKAYGFSECMGIDFYPAPEGAGKGDKMKITFAERVAVCLALDAVEKSMKQERSMKQDERGDFVDDYENFLLKLTNEQMADLRSANKKLKGE